MITMDIGLFRTNYPEFADSSLYPNTMITYWATLAEQLVKQCVWKNSWTIGVNLYVAHELTIAAQSKKTASFGGTPGTFGGVPNNKAVGGASVGYDSSATSEKDAGYWNLSNYGKQFIRLARIFGAGTFQL